MILSDVKKTNLFDIDKIRNDFPIFKNNPDLVFLDNASTTQKPQIVINTISYFYENYNIIALLPSINV